MRHYPRFIVAGAHTLLGDVRFAWSSYDGRTGPTAVRP